MASNTLFPPVVNNVEPAFVTNYATKNNDNWEYLDGDPGELKIYFMYSALNAGLDKSAISVHATIHLKSGGSILNTQDGQSEGTMPGTHRLRQANMILNLKPEQDDPNSDEWYITLKNDDIKQLQTQAKNNTNLAYFGWVPGCIYKIQIRLSSVNCGIADETRQQAWLFENADLFSEWTNVIYSKAISKMDIETYCDYSLDTVFPTVQIINYPQLFEGGIIADDSQSNEFYSIANLKLYESDSYGNLNEENKLEEVELYPNDISNKNFKYTFKYAFENLKYYLITFSYTTDNKYKSNMYKYFIQYQEEGQNSCNFGLAVVDQDKLLVKKVEYPSIGKAKKYYTSLGQENDNGCIGLKLIWTGGEIPQSEDSIDIEVNLYIIRSDELNNFTNWEDIKIINLKMLNIQDKADIEQRLEDLDMIFDYNIESNIYYKYGVQSLDLVSDPPHRSRINALDKYIMRDFEYSYILGKDQTQLKLKFDNIISNFTTQIYDTKIETIGSQYPYVYRNSKIKYKTFPISGLISFDMDDDNTFLHNGKLDIYKNELINNLHEQDKIKNLGKYDRGYERRFRQKVLDFLSDGEVKLFKSPTEGNILVRIRDINCTPNQQLNRLVYSFSANADEIDKYSMNNLLKYGILYPGMAVTDFNNIDDIISHNVDYKNEDIHIHDLSNSFISPTNIPPQKKNNNNLIGGV